MNLSNLISIKGKNKKRVGRGTGSGKGKTSGRGTKGQKSRSGGGVRLGFEGGQMPLTQRVPKLKGFKSRKPKNQVVKLSDLNLFTGKVTKEKLHEKGLIKSANWPVKILGSGKLEKTVEVHVEYFSKTAEKEIVKKGGKVIIKKPQKQKEENKESKK
ncbi:50S ribosomal protein L15 [candidate division WS5 bacterium]|uniref:Large ribosomal subunit protein uL15 n=1 Tax=candidate division WS5 bacterium TaxID=2093353 RepID=A0A419DAB4_9BACT|nr:MAG: 50S ribosomal protein L15 [candidate division WS5 bacterium]